MSTNSRVRIWPVPILLGVISAIGLIAALLSEGLGDYLGWLTLAIPVAVVLWYAPRRKSRKTNDAESSTASDYV